MCRLYKIELYQNMHDGETKALTVKIDGPSISLVLKCVYLKKIIN